MGGAKGSDARQAILRHADKVRGLTTAATLWLARTRGLCFGGDQQVLSPNVLTQQPAHADDAEARHPIRVAGLL
jgi:hypothetical protein